MFTRLKAPILSLALLPFLAPASLADGFGISFSKKSKHGALSIGYSTGFAPAHGGHCAPSRRFVPGHYETVYRQVWVEGCSRNVRVDPVYEFRRDAYGRTYPMCVSNGGYQVVQEPGHFETRPFRVWVAGHWSY